MSVLVPQPLAALLARALGEFASRRSVFELPQRSFWPGREGFDLSVETFGERIATPLGPAAGPHTQLAPNLVVAWLAGARALELKTVQVNDRLTIPRPCIDAPDLGFNVEWSQELALADSAREYAKAWLLVHALAARGLAPAAAGPREVAFHASVGYDLAGIASATMARFLDEVTDASRLLEALRRELPPALRAMCDVPVPSGMVRTLTLSTFHGCPPEQIERIVEHLFARHGVHVVIKFNPTLLGFAETEDLLRGRLGYSDIVLDRAAFDSDLSWDAALGLCARLESAARRAGLSLGAKFTNTLVVRNDRRVLAGRETYLSGPPLHPIAVTLAARFSQATGGRIPISFSGGVNADNFADTVACGLAPVTTCTDLLRPTGYRRLPRYLKALAAAMDENGVRSLRGFVRPGGLVDYAARVLDDPAYRAANRAPAPAPRVRRLRTFDCESCNNCLLVCPNAAFFTLAIPRQRLAAPALRADGTADGTDMFEIVGDRQWVVFADACNACGNCTTFCPEAGAPDRVKPRFHATPEAFAAAAPADGLVLEDAGRRVNARVGGRAYTLVTGERTTVFSDGTIEAELDGNHGVRALRTLGGAPGGALPLSIYHALRVLRDALLVESRFRGFGDPA